MLEALLRRHDRALEHFAAALALEERARADALAAVTRTWWARTLLDRGRPGDRDRAADLLAGAEETVARCGLRHLDHDLAVLRPRCGVS
jgi:hypothetical protein